jgi:ABC-type glycerol-3-phosphate transport system substrate-binding protein
MKKVIAIVAIATSLVACGGASTAPVATDSTAVKTDSVKVDSTIAPAADSTKK